MALTDWQPIIPRHGRVLTFLRDNGDPRAAGSIGARAVCEPGDRFTYEQLTDPLKERGLIETCEAYRMAGHLFLRLTDFGKLCLDFGMMPKAPRRDPESVKRYSAQVDAEMKQRAAMALQAPAQKGKVVDGKR